MPPSRKAIAKPSHEIETPFDRGQALKAWIQRMGLDIQDFAEAANLSRAALNNYLRGIKDVATVEQEIADRLLRAMGISDGEAWSMLNIPAEHRHTFRSFRPPPLGHGSVTRTLADIRLEEPLFGSVALPAGTLIRVASEGPALEHVIVRLNDGRLYAASNGVQAEGQQLGYLVSAHFSIQQ